MHFYTPAIVFVCFCMCAAYGDEGNEPNVGILRFGRSGFEPELPGMMFGKRDELPGMMFGKRGVEDMQMMFGKRGLENMQMMFGKRDELPGMMFGKRDGVEDMGLMFGKRPASVPVSDELYRTMFRTMHGKRDLTFEEMQAPMFGKRPDESSQPELAAKELAAKELAANLGSASFGKREPVEAKNQEKENSA